MELKGAMGDWIMTVPHTLKKSPGVVDMGGLIMADYSRTQIIKSGDYSEQNNNAKNDNFPGNITTRKGS